MKGYWFCCHPAINIQYNAAGLQVHVRWCVLQALRELNWIWWSGEVGTLHSEGDTSSLAEAELWAGPGGNCRYSAIRSKVSKYRQPVRGVDEQCSEEESGLVKHQLGGH